MYYLRTLLLNENYLRRQNEIVYCCLKEMALWWCSDFNHVAIRKQASLKFSSWWSGFPEEGPVSHAIRH